ncbi:MAG TPA: helix-turn-helix domain-containing protein [Thermomicrobiales bacterium]|nr:helix-turn-helix domain-containing protein [Thermomicrobiales bacterium]
MLTVRDIIGIALPPGTLIVAGEAGLGREVTWATRLRPTPPAFGHLDGGELVLLPADILDLLDERLTLEAAVQQLASFGVAAIGLLGEADAAARAAADGASVPLLQLPADAELGPVEREASRVITEQRRAIQRRGQDVGRRLMELAIAGEPLSTVVSDLATLSGRPVALEGRDGRLLAYHPTAGSADRTTPTREAVERLLSDGHSRLASWLRKTAASSPAEPPATMTSLGSDWVRTVAPVIGRDGLLGSLSLLMERESESPEDEVLTSRGAAACAVVLAREQAAASVRREVELNVLDEVLDGALRSEVSLLQQAKRLGHDLEAPHVALVARMDRQVAGQATTVSRQRDGRWAALDEIIGRIDLGSGARPLWRVRNNSAELVWPARETVEASGLAKTLQAGLAGAIRESSESVSIAYGRPRTGIDGIRRSHQEARQALTLGRRLHGLGHLTGFDDLGIYRLIFAAEALPELRAFHAETLDSLLAYDRQHGAGLVRTLEAYFQANGSPKEAATLLSVHRNTVLYRLDRIAEITGLDLSDADTRLRLQVALRINLALFDG